MTIQINENTDGIAFLFSYYAGEAPSIEMADISHIDHETKQVLVHFLYGYKSMGEWIKFEDIVALLPKRGSDLSDPSLTSFKIKGWSGYYRKILRPDVWAQFQVKPNN